MVWFRGSAVFWNWGWESSSLITPPLTRAILFFFLHRLTNPFDGTILHLLTGADIYDVVLILRTQRAVKAFVNPKVSIGGELTVTAGPVGAGAVVSKTVFIFRVACKANDLPWMMIWKVDTGIELSPVLSYIKSRGLYGGIQLDGTQQRSPFDLFSHRLWTLFFFLTWCISMILSTITLFGRDFIHDSLHHKVTLLSRGLTRTSASTGVKSVPRKFSLERRKDHRMRIYLWLLLRVRREGISNMWFTLKRRVLKPTMTRKTRGFLLRRVGVKRLRTFYRVPSFFFFFFSY